MMNKEMYQKAVLVVTAFENDRIHTDVLIGSGPIALGNSLPTIQMGTPINALSDLTGQRDNMGG